MRLTLFGALLAVLVLLVGGLAFWLLAPYNIAASSPHWPGVSAVLHGYMKNAVTIRAAAVERPDWYDPDDPAPIRLGAAHFATGCATCHGAPGVARNAIATAMLPAPTPVEAADYTPEGFYWVVRHGLKYTGMPAWTGTGRDDEPWAVAAFLARYATLKPEDYRTLAWGGAESGREGAAIAFGGMTGIPAAPIENCARCHGTDGLGRDGTAPRLAGQDADYLEAALDAYAEDRRQSGFMEPVAVHLTVQRRRALARRYAAMESRRWPGRESVRGDAARGRALALRGDEHEDIPACVACHGSAERPRKTGVPRIAGQDPRWIAVWLRMWRDGPVPDTPGAERMAAAARPLGDADIADLASYFGAGAPSEP